MTLEQQVASLVSATTDLTSVVNTELNNVRTENTNFKNGLATSFSSKNIVATEGLKVENSGFVGIHFVNNLKRNNTSLKYGYSFYNMKQGENGSVGINALALYSYSSDSQNNMLISIPFVLQDNNSIRLGSPGIALGDNSYAIGVSLQSASVSYSNIVGVGSGSEVSGSNQIQLGNSNTTTYAYGSVQVRSDLRDKVDIRTTTLGLSFIKSLRPVDFRWDLRDSYRTPAPKILDPQASESEKALYDTELKKWQEENKISNLIPNGSKKGRRYHHGIIAQELQESIRATGIDFGGFQDHKISGGDDVLSVGYSEFIAPLIKAVQELSDMNDVLKERVKALEAKIA